MSKKRSGRVRDSTSSHYECHDRDGSSRFRVWPGCAVSRCNLLMMRYRLAWELGRISDVSTIDRRTRRLSRLARTAFDVRDEVYQPLPTFSDSGWFSPPATHYVHTTGRPIRRELRGLMRATLTPGASGVPTTTAKGGRLSSIPLRHGCCICC